MKTWHPEAWKPLGIKPVEDTQTVPTTKETHSFLGTKTVDIATGETLTSFYDHYMSGVYRPRRSNEEIEEIRKRPYDNIEQEKQDLGTKILGSASTYCKEEMAD